MAARILSCNLQDVDTMLAGSLIWQCGAKFRPGKTRHLLSFKIDDCEAIDLRVKLEFAFLSVAIN